MKRIGYLPLLFILISCSPKLTQESPTPHITEAKPALNTVRPSPVLSGETAQTTEIANTPDIKATLIATSPSLEISFDGAECTIQGEDKIAAGEHIFVFHNQSGQRSILIVGRLYPDKSWEDFLQWFNENCGSPGSDCEGGDAPWISWLFESKSTEQGLERRYYQYDLQLEAEYILVASDMAGSVFWPCGVFALVAGN